MRSAERQPSRSRAPSQAEGKCGSRKRAFPVLRVTVPPARSDGMDHILAGQSISFVILHCRFRSRPASTLGKQLRSCSPMDAAVNTAASQKRAVRRVDNSIHFHLVMSFVQFEGAQYHPPFNSLKLLPVFVVTTKNSVYRVSISTASSRVVTKNTSLPLLLS